MCAGGHAREAARPVLRTGPLPSAACMHVSPAHVSAHRQMDSVTAQADGYFAQAAPPVGRLPRPIDFGLLLGESGWRSKQAALYRQLQVPPLPYLPILMLSFFLA